MFIQAIIEYSADDSEANVYVSDGYYSLLCYMYPAYKLYVGKIIKLLYAYNCSDIVLNGENEYKIVKTNETYSYNLSAIVISRKNSIVGIGGIHMLLDSAIPSDIYDGQFVSFSVQRLDA